MRKLFYRFIILSLRLAIIILFELSALAEVEKPVNPIIYAGCTHQFELYWFYRNEHIEKSGNMISNPARYGYPGEEDRQYSVFTRFSLTPPLYISKASAYIMNIDDPYGWPGNQFSPIRLSLKKRASPVSYSDLWYEYVNLDIDTYNAGEVITRPVNLCLDYTFEVWLAYEWLAGTPKAPFLGMNTTSPYLEQYICPMDDSSYQFEATYDNYMAELEILNWRNIDDKQFRLNADNPMKFEVLYARDTVNFESDCQLIAEKNVDSLNLNFSLPFNGFITVMATDGITESFSEYIYLDIEKLPPLSVSPSSIEMICENGAQNSGAIYIYNYGSDVAKMHFNYDSTLINLSSDSVLIEAGLGVTLKLQLKDNVPNKWPFSSSIVIETVGDYYPILYHLMFRNNEASWIDDENKDLPEGVFVSEPYPNPFNSQVEMVVEVAGRRNIQMDVFNILGQNVYTRQLYINRNKVVSWDGCSNAGDNPGSGMFLFRFTGGENTVIRKAVLLK